VPQVPHPAFRRLSAAGATASRLHATLARVERELGGVTFGLDGLRLLDDTVLAPLTRRIGVAEALTRARGGAASEADAPASGPGGDVAERAVRPRRVDHWGRPEQARTQHDAATRSAGQRHERTASESPREGHAPTAGHAHTHARHGIRASATMSEAHESSRAAGFEATRDSRFAHADPALLRDARAAVARRLDSGSPAAVGAPARDVAVLRAPRPRTEETRQRSSGFDVNGGTPDTALSSNRLACLSARDASVVTPLRIGKVSQAVTDILEGSAPGRQTPASDERSAVHRERAAAGMASPQSAHHALDTMLERAAERVSTRVPKRGARASLAPAHRTGQSADTHAAPRSPDGALDAASGLRRLISRAGVTPLSAAHPPQAGVERVEGTLGVVADRVEENALAQRLGQLLRREARRDGIDLDETGA
jgi:hypothetical protein